MVILTHILLDIIFQCTDMEYQDTYKDIHILRLHIVYLIGGNQRVFIFTYIFILYLFFFINKKFT